MPTAATRVIATHELDALWHGTALTEGVPTFDSVRLTQRSASTALCWAWWRTLTPDHKRPQSDIAALVQACLKQKGIHVRMRANTFDALTKTTGTAIENRLIEDGTREVARSELYKALELLDANR